jgi:hypothetical protein
LINQANEAMQRGDKEKADELIGAIKFLQIQTNFNCCKENFQVVLA